MHNNQQFLLETCEPISEHSHSLWKSRSLVVGLTLSFVLFLAVFWLSGTLVDVPQLWQTSLLLQFLADHRSVMLVLPAVCLASFYFALRYLTGEILAVPERYMVERQKMIRDQAHRSAFKIIKAACVLISLSVVLIHLPS